MTDSLWMLWGMGVLLVIIGLGLVSTIQRIRAKNFDDYVLRAIQELGGKSYGVPIRQKVSAVYYNGREISFGRLYDALDRLIRAGHLVSEVAPLTAHDRIFRGGRRRMMYLLTDKGAHYLDAKNLTAESTVPASSDTEIKNENR